MAGEEIAPIKELADLVERITRVQAGYRAMGEACGRRGMTDEAAACWHIHGKLAAAAISLGGEVTQYRSERLLRQVEMERERT